MASLISSDDKTTLNSIMEDQHDTFARPIICYKDAVKTVSTKSTSFNSVYGNAGATTSIVNTPQPITVNARVQYEKKYPQEYLEDGNINSQLKVNIDEGRVRIKIKSSDFANVKECKRFEFDSRVFYLDSDFRAHGLFDAQYYTFYVNSDQ